MRKLFLLVLPCLLMTGCGAKFSYDTLEDVCEGAIEICEFLPEIDSVIVYKNIEVPIYYPECFYFGTSVAYFDTDSHKIIDTAPLEIVLTALNSCPSATVIITGHCDERAGDAYNKALGTKRASEVAAWLRNAGISRSRMTVKSYGETEPFVAGHDENSWEMNRRVEIVAE